MTKRFLIVGITFGLLIAAISFFNYVFLPSVIEKAIRGGPVPTETIAAEPAKADSWTPYVRAIGTVKAETGIDLAPKTGGVVRKIGFSDGEKVTAGQVLYELDNAQEMADLKAQSATLQNLEADLKRRRELKKQGFLAQSELDAAIARRAEAAGALERTKAVIADKVIRAPWNGTAGITKVDVGAFVAPGTMLVRLQAIDTVFIDFTVPEQEFARIKPGQPVLANVGAWPKEAFEGTVQAVDAQVVENTRAFTVRARLANPEGRLVPGMFASVSVVAGEPVAQITVPQTAITYSLYGDSVYVVVPQADAQAGTTDTGEPKLQAERRFVRIGEARDSRVAILEGVKPGEQVVTAGQLKLRPGVPVRIDNSVGLTINGERKTE